MRYKLSITNQGEDLGVIVDSSKKGINSVWGSCVNSKCPDGSHLRKRVENKTANITQFNHLELQHRVLVATFGKKEG